MNAVKKITAGINNKDNKQYVLHKALLLLYAMRQGDTELNNSYFTRFKSNVQNLELVGGANFFFSDKHGIYSGEALNEIEKEQAKEKFLAMCFIKRSDPGRYKVLLDQLQQSLYLGRNEYPIKLVNMYNTLIQYSGQFTSNRPCNRNPANKGRGRDA